MILGCINETAGYIGRVLMYYNPWSFAAFILQISIISPSAPRFVPCRYLQELIGE